ncbi:MFS transporter, partial [Faecalibaculum rodentium]
MSTVTDSQRSRIMIGCYFVMFTIAAYGLSLATIQQPMLDSMGGGSYFSLITLIAAICMTIMTPIGGRLIDGLGNRTVTLYAGAISLISGLVMAFVPNLWVFIIMRILFSMAQGAMSSVPYILAREVNPPQVQGKIFGMLATVLAVGSFVGSWLAGVLVQNNLMWLAVAFPCLTLAPGTWLIYK